MTASQNLFRRHRTRDVDENDTPPVVSANSGEEGVSSSPASLDVTNSSIDNTVTNNRSDNDNDEEQELIVQVPHSNSNASTTPPFVLQHMVVEPSEEARALRRESIRQEVERVQRANFIHFLVLCLVPTTLLVIVITAILSEDGECSGVNDGVNCEREPRSFVNAFTSRCICDAIQSIQNNEVDLEETDGGV